MGRSSPSSGPTAPTFDSPPVDPRGTMGGVGDLATEFEAERDHLTAVAYRMLGSRAEAEDAVQEAWLRYAGAADPTPRRDPRSARLADHDHRADLPRRAAVGAGAPGGVPRAVASGAAWSTGCRRAAPDPAETAARSDEVGTALLVVLERLTPGAAGGVRAARRVRGAVRGDRTALGTTVPAARQLASRARRAVADGRAPAHRRPGRAAAGAERVPDAPPSPATSTGCWPCSRPTWCSSATAAAYFPAARQPVVGAAGGPVRARAVPAASGRTPARCTPRSCAVNGGLGVLVRGAATDGQAVPLGDVVRHGRRPDHRHLQPAQPGEAGAGAGARRRDGWPPPVPAAT